MSGNRNEFGKKLSLILEEKGATQTDLAANVGLSSSVYVNHLTTGKRSPSPLWIDTVALALQLSDAEAVELHRAAARDKGFKLDLTKE